MSGTPTESIANEVTWRWSLRRDLSIARLLMSGEELDGVYGISAATIVDRLFCWLEMLGIWDKLRGMKGECAQVLQEGITHRGDWCREGVRENLPLDPEAMSKNIVKLRLSEVQDLCRWVLKAVWGSIPVVPKKLLGAIDGTFIEPGASSEGAGRASRHRRIRTREGVKEVTETILGFKMVWLWVPSVGLPLAVAFGRAEEDEKKFVEGLLRDAREVLGERGKLGTVVEEVDTPSQLQPRKPTAVRSPTRESDPRSRGRVTR